jgi:hypothetical protein
MAEMTVEQVESEVAIYYDALHSVTGTLGQAGQLLVAKARLKGMRDVLETASQIASPRNEEWTKFRARQLRAARYRNQFNR